MQYTKLNCGSGQRPFDNTHGWCNIDKQDRFAPNLVADWNDLGAFADNSIEYVVSHHSIEHVGCGEADGFVREAYRVLRPGGSLLVFVPDLKALAKRWLLGQIDDYIYMVNVYGAYMGDEADRHKFGYSSEGLREYIGKLGAWSKIKLFDWRKIEGADIAGPDWWILAVEAVK